MFLSYNLLVFLTGFLILSVQLVFSKSILPVFGGTPNVWITSLAFYQIVLTLGYGYAYFMQKKVPIKLQIPIHISLFLSSLFFIPISLNYIPEEINSFFDIFKTIFLSIGIPYFLLTASSPLFQHWFSKSNDNKAHNPYVLYVSSNLGTFLSLILYPFFIEIFFSVDQQFKLWSNAFLFNIVLILICGFLLFKNLSNEKTNNIQMEKSTIKPFIWILFAFIPSGLLSVITNKLTIDIAPIPLLWVIPLALYFLSFSIGFSDKFKYFKQFNYLSLLLSICTFIIVSFDLHHIYWGVLFILTLFFVSVTFHNYLYLNSPNTKHLTLFYFLLSVGGAFGGSFVGILSPLVFDNYYENFIFLGLTILASLYLMKTKKYNKLQNIIHYFPSILILSLLFLKFYYSNDFILQKRSFFGVHTISLLEDKEYKFKTLLHGTTLHGSQIVSNDIQKQSQPLSYYSFNNPIFFALNDLNFNNKLNNFGVIGLGAGTMNCLFHNKKITFFEIDPMIINIAKNEFSFIDICNNDLNFIVGDARITTNDIAKNQFNAFVIDAFSSDSIPVHLLTKEAIELYSTLIKEDGFLIFHISNRYLNLEPVLGNIAKSLNLESKQCVSLKKNNNFENVSNVVVIGKNLDLLTHTCWNNTKTDLLPVWSDKYSNLFNYIK